MSLPNPPKSGYPVSQPLFVYINNLVIHNNFLKIKGILQIIMYTYLMIGN